jgi:H+-translocating NAD(P) transhydrogenase subunit alpha
VLAVAFAMLNVVGGFLVTDRMLQMFRRREEER